jgi:hypothetical protein
LTPSAASQTNQLRQDVCMAKNKYADDYETVISIDEKGKEKRTTVYRGKFFELENSEEQITRFKRSCLLFLIGILTLHVAAGFIGNQGMYQFYIGLPYVLVFFPLLHMAEGIFRLPREKRKYRRDEIGHSYDQIKTASTILLCVVAVGVLGELIFILFFSTTDQKMLEYPYLALEALVTAEVFFIFSKQKQFSVRVCSDASQ